MSQDVNEMLRRQQEEVERIRARRGKRGGAWKEPVRRVLNVLFLTAAVVGFILYFRDETHDLGFLIIMGGMVVKVMEFIIRFLG